jgi:hypothetical protein
MFFDEFDVQFDVQREYWTFDRTDFDEVDFIKRFLSNG